MKSLTQRLSLQGIELNNQGKMPLRNLAGRRSGPPQ
jgi:hypothetical protein